MTNNIWNFFFTACCHDREMVKEVITSPNVGPHSPRADLLDKIALALDTQSLVFANWIRLAQQVGVPRKLFKQFGRRSTQSPTFQLFQYLAATCPQMVLKPLKEALEAMKRIDLLKLLQDQDLDGKFKDRLQNFASFWHELFGLNSNVAAQKTSGTSMKIAGGAGERR